MARCYAFFRAVATGRYKFLPEGYEDQGDSEGRETEPDTPSDEQQTRYSSERKASGHRFFYENEQREANDPNQVHDAPIEQEDH